MVLNTSKPNKTPDGNVAIQLDDNINGIKTVFASVNDNTGQTTLTQYTGSVKTDDFIFDDVILKGYHRTFPFFASVNNLATIYLDKTQHKIKKAVKNNNPQTSYVTTTKDVAYILWVTDDLNFSYVSTNAMVIVVENGNERELPNPIPEDVWNLLNNGSLNWENVIGTPHQIVAKIPANPGQAVESGIYTWNLEDSFNRTTNTKHLRYERQKFVYDIKNQLNISENNFMNFDILDITPFSDLRDNLMFSRSEKKPNRDKNGIMPLTVNDPTYKLDPNSINVENAMNLGIDNQQVVAELNSFVPKTSNQIDKKLVDNNNFEINPHSIGGYGFLLNLSKQETNIVATTNAGTNGWHGVFAFTTFNTFLPNLNNAQRLTQIENQLSDIWGFINQIWEYEAQQNDLINKLLNTDVANHLTGKLVDDYTYRITQTRKDLKGKALTSDAVDIPVITSRDPYVLLAQETLWTGDICMPGETATLKNPRTNYISLTASGYLGSSKFDLTTSNSDYFGPGQINTQDDTSTNNWFTIYNCETHLRPQSTTVYKIDFVHYIAHALNHSGNERYNIANFNENENVSESQVYRPQSGLEKWDGFKWSEDVFSPIHFTKIVGLKEVSLKA